MAERIEESKFNKLRDIVRNKNKPEKYVLERDDSHTIKAYVNNVKAIDKLWTESRQEQTIKEIQDKYVNVKWRRWQFKS